MSYRNR